MSLVEYIEVSYNDDCIAAINFVYLDGENSECILNEEVIEECEKGQFKVRAGKNEYIRGAITYTNEDGGLQAIKFISSFARMKLFGNPDDCERGNWGEPGSGSIMSISCEDGIEVEFDTSVLKIYQNRRMRNLTAWVSSAEYGEVEDAENAGVHGFRFNFKGGLFHDMGSKKGHKQLSVNLGEEEHVTSARIYSMDERVKFVRFFTTEDRKVDFGAPELVADCDLTEIEAPEESKILILNFDLESDRWEEDDKVMDFPPLTSAIFQEVEEEVEPEEPEEEDPFEGLDPMDLANEIADMREKMGDHYTQEKLMEILCGIDSRDDIYEAMEGELIAFAENFVEENAVLPAVPDISKLVERYEDKCQPMYDAKWMKV